MVVPGGVAVSYERGTPALPIPPRDTHTPDIDTNNLLITDHTLQDTSQCPPSVGVERTSWNERACTAAKARAMALALNLAPPATHSAWRDTSLLPQAATPDTHRSAITRCCNASALVTWSARTSLRCFSTGK